MRLTCVALLGILIVVAVSGKPAKKHKHTKAHAKSGGIALDTKVKKLESKKPKDAKASVGKSDDKVKQQPAPVPPGWLPAPSDPPPACEPPCMAGPDGITYCPPGCPPPPPEAPPPVPPYPPPPYPPPPPEVPPPPPYVPPPPVPPPPVPPPAPPVEPPPPPPPVPPPPPFKKITNAKGDEAASEEEDEGSAATDMEENVEQDNDKENKKKNSKSKETKSEKATAKSHKKGTVLTHSVNKISQTPNANRMHATSHSKSESHLKQNTMRRRKRSVSSKKVKSHKKGTVFTHTVNRISQTPSAAARGASHTSSTSRLKKVGARKKRQGVRHPHVTVHRPGISSRFRLRPTLPAVRFIDPKLKNMRFSEYRNLFPSFSQSKESSSEQSDIGFLSENEIYSGEEDNEQNGNNIEFPSPLLGYPMPTPSNQPYMMFPDPFYLKCTTTTTARPSTLPPHLTSIYPTPNIPTISKFEKEKALKKLLEKNKRKNRSKRKKKDKKKKIRE